MALQTPTISKRYRNQWVLRDVSLDIEPGRVVALLGAPGSGKTTFLKILAGRARGSPEIADRDWHGSRITLYPERNESALARLFGRAARNSDDSGWLRRVLDGASNIVLLDDPLCGFGEKEAADACVAIRDAARRQHLSVVYATSSFPTAALVADSIAVLGKGTVLQTDTPEAIYDSPLTTEIARLTGRCNIIEARRLTSSKSDTPEFQTISGGHRLFTEKADVAKLGPLNRSVPLAIRPESVVISFGASFPEDNLIRATVTATRFLGPTTVVELDANGLSLEAMVFRVVGLNVGDECMIALPPDRIRVLAG